MSITDVANFLHAHHGQRFAVIAHDRPDGDALGSCIGLVNFLNDSGSPAKAVISSTIPKHLAYLVQGAAVDLSPKENWWQDYDCLGILDCGEVGRLEDSAKSAPEHLATFTIDHHTTGDGLGVAVWQNPKASSIGEMLATLYAHENRAMSPAAAQAIWTALVTDTGRFSYENTSAEAMQAAWECVKAGANPAAAASELYQSVTLAERRLQGMVLNRLEVRHQGRLTTSWLNRADFAQAETGPEERANLINLLRDIEGVQAAIFFYELPPKDGQPQIKVSFRTRAPICALDVACRYGGGGHERAAGCTLTLPLAAAREAVLATAAEVFFGVLRGEPSYCPSAAAEERRAGNDR